MNGKSDKPRPMTVTHQEYSDNWDRVFGRVCANNTNMYMLSTEEDARINRIVSEAATIGFGAYREGACHRCKIISELIEELKIIGARYGDIPVIGDGRSGVKMGVVESRREYGHHLSVMMMPDREDK